jgi:hypothetical protein
MYEPKAVLVVWEDASTEEGGPWVWASEAKPLEPVVFAQLGWLMHEDETCIVLSEAVSADGGKIHSSRERIPRGMVRSITEVCPASKQSKRSKR